jgi:hypothetical protein
MKSFRTVGCKPNQATVKFWNSHTFHDLVIVLSSLFCLQDVLEFYA